MFWNSLGVPKKAMQNTRHENGFRHNGRHYCTVRSFLLRLGCDSTYRYKISRRQAGLCLACITEPHVRTCVWTCEVTCTHVGYSKLTMGGEARWKKEGVAAMWVNIHKHAASRGDVTASQTSSLVSTCNHLYILPSISLFSLSVSFLVSFFLSFFPVHQLLLLTSCHASFRLVSLLICLHVLFLSSSAYLLYSHIPSTFPIFSYIFFLPLVFYSFIFTFPLLSLTATHRRCTNNLIAQFIVPSFAVRYIMQLSSRRRTNTQNEPNQRQSYLCSNDL
jgi:hypothetical protein